MDKSQALSLNSTGPCNHRQILNAEHFKEFAEKMNLECNFDIEKHAPYGICGFKLEQGQQLLLCPKNLNSPKGSVPNQLFLSKEFCTVHRLKEGEKVVGK